MKYKIKDIYIIKNDINDKVYIGQSVNPAHRWQQYISAVKYHPNVQLITKAMHKYGIEHFTMSILEKDVVNYDEREIYWINYYNSIKPNGYNIAPGGQGSGWGTLASGAKIKSEEVLAELIEDLADDKLTIAAISEKYNISLTQVNAINIGQAYYNSELHYPIRESKRYSKEKLDQITYSLKYELDKSLRQIAKEYDIDLSHLNEINQGKMHYRKYLTYPIRLGKMKKAEIIHPQILEKLLTTDLPQKEIAKLFNVSQNLVSEINRGKKCHRDDLEYPIRKNGCEYYSTLSPDIIKEIYKLLLETDLSFKEIGKRYDVSPNVIAGINNGKTKKYRNENYIYPLRKS